MVGPAERSDDEPGTHEVDGHGKVPRETPPQEDPTEDVKDIVPIVCERERMHDGVQVYGHKHERYHQRDDPYPRPVSTE